MSTTNATRNVVDSIDDMLRQIDATAQAEKTAEEAHTEPGGFQGATEHPSKAVDDRTDTGQEGSRSAENTADVKEDQGSPGVDNTTPGTPGGQDSVQMNLGLQSSATGEDSSIETESAKGGKEDPGTQRGKSTHPARTDNEQLDGHKYSCEQLIEGVDKLEKLGRELVAAIAVYADGEVQKRAAAELARQKEAEGKGPEDKESKDTPPEGKAKIGKAPPPPEEKEAQGTIDGPDKKAQDEMVVDAIACTIQDAFDMADKTAVYLKSLEAEVAKTADKETAAADPTLLGGNTSDEEEEPSNEDRDRDRDRREPPENGAPPAPEGEGGGLSEEALLNALAGGEDMGAEDAAGAMGGEPAGGLGAALGAGEPAALGAGEPAGGLLGAGEPAAGGLGAALGAGEPGAALGAGEPAGGPAAGGLLGAGGPAAGGPAAGGPAAGGVDALLGAGEPGPGPGLGAGAPGPGLGLGAGEPGVGEAGGMGPTEEDLMILEQALRAVGITPEEFEAAIAGKAAQALKERSKQAKDNEQRWQPKTAAEAQRLQETIKYVKELVRSGK